MRVDGLGEAYVNSSASSRDGVVAAGSGIWFSRDTQTWTLVLSPAELGGPPGAPQQGVINDVTAGGPGFVAAGQAVDPASGQAVAAIWTSPDGQRWSRVRASALEPPTPPIPPGDSTPTRGSIHAVARGGPGLVAVGGVFAGRFQGRTLVSHPYEPAIWTSTDASHWRRVDTTKAFGAGPSAWSLADVVAHHRSIITTATVDSTTVIFESRDGAHWKRIATQPGAYKHVITYRDRLVAAGNERATASDERAAVWTSRDARHWQRVFGSGSERFASYTSLASNGNSLVAVGYRGHYETAVDAIMTVSGDARTWQPVPADGGAFAPSTHLDAVTVFGTRYLAFGVEITEGQGTRSDPYRSRNDLFISASTT
jgi:hypothetical protein